MPFLLEKTVLATPDLTLQSRSLNLCPEGGTPDLTIEIDPSFPRPFSLLCICLCICSCICVCVSMCLSVCVCERGGVCRRGGGEA